MRKYIGRRTIVSAFLLLVALLVYWSQIVPCLVTGQYTVQRFRIDQAHTLVITSECDLESQFEPAIAHYVAITKNKRTLIGPTFLEAWDRSSVDYSVVGSDSGPIVGLINSKRPNRVLVVFDRSTGDVLSHAHSGDRELWKRFTVQTGVPSYVFDSGFYP